MRARLCRPLVCSPCSPGRISPPTAWATCRPTARASAATARRPSPRRARCSRASACATSAIPSSSSSPTRASTPSTPPSAWPWNIRGCRPSPPPPMPARRARRPCGTRRPTTWRSCGRRDHRRRSRAPSRAPRTSRVSISSSAAWRWPRWSRARPSASSIGARSATRCIRGSRDRTARARCSPPRSAWSRTACAWSASTSAAPSGCAADSIPRWRSCCGRASASAAR